MTSNEGGCLCGAVRYQVTGRVLYSTVCHCRSCRKASGAPSVAWLTFERTGFRYLCGTPKTIQSTPGVTRSFCGDCGTTLTYERIDRLDTLDVTTVSTDCPERFAPTAEIWLQDRLPWESVNAQLAHYPAGIE